MQKGSLYLADANYLWHMSFQMGLKFTVVEEQYEHYVPNSTKCSRWSDVKRSHLEKERPVTLNYRVVHLVAEHCLLTSNLKFRQSMNL